MSPRTKEQFELIRQGSKQKILDAALEIFARYGYHSSSVSSIAQKAGISQGLMYNYFKSKDEVLYELMIGMIVPLVKEIMPVQPEQEMEKKDMIKLISSSVDFAIKYPDYWKLYISVFVQPDVIPKIFDKVRELFTPFITALTSYFKAKGEKDPLTMTRYFLAVMDGVQMHMIFDPGTFPKAQVKKLLIKQFA
jgi:AcrR family transcriptional regulator